MDVTMSNNEVMDDPINCKIRDFLSPYFSDSVLKDDENIFENGILNSLFAMQLVLFVEKTFNISIEQEDLDMRNFQTINSIRELVFGKLN